MPGLSLPPMPDRDSPQCSSRPLTSVGVGSFSSRG